MNFLRLLREQAGLTQTEVADRFFDRSAISRWERDDRELHQILLLVLIKRKTGAHWDEIGVAVEQWVREKYKF